MDAAADRAPDPLAAWLAATEGVAASPPPAPDAAPDGSARRAPSLRPRLVVVAALPWLLVVALAAAALNRTPPPASSAAAPAPAGPTPATASTIPATPPEAAPAPAGMDDRLAAAAVLTLRLAIPADQYLDTAVAEQAAALDGAVVVTVAAAVLDRVDGRWTGPRHVRFAVPLSAGQPEPVALGAPWVVPSDAPQQAEPTTTAVDDAALATSAVTTLRAAGYRDVATPQLRRHTALPDIIAVQVHARAPGEPAGRAHEIWLDATGSRVLGGPAPSTPAQLPAPVPAEAP